MSIVKPKNFSYIKGPKGDKGDRGESGSGVVGTTGRITYNATTKTVGFNEAGLATTAYVNSTIDNLVNGAPALLDTLNELSEAIGNNPNFVIDITANIASEVSRAIAAENDINARLNVEIVRATTAEETMSMNKLTDVDTSTVTPTVGDILVWNGTNWVPGPSVSSIISNASLDSGEF